MLRRKVVKNLLLFGGALTALGSSAAGWQYAQLTKAPDWKLLQANQELLAELTETILPATSTPGAIAAGVPAFVQQMVKTNLDVKSQNNFVNGLRDVSDYCQANFGKAFSKCTATEKEQTLSHFEKMARSFNSLAAKARNVLVGKPFFSVLRDLTIVGYCTSELGATEGLAYDPIPGTFAGCLSYVQGQKSWATQ